MGARSLHAVKPFALMRWLVRLVTPADGLLLDPFCGSGSTGCAAVLEGRRSLVSLCGDRHADEVGASDIPLTPARDRP